MYAALRYIYDLPYMDLFADENTKLQSLAKLYVVAEKYQLKGLHKDITKHMYPTLRSRTAHGMENLDEAELDDCLAAVKIVSAGTTTQDQMGRESLVTFCVLNIRELKQLPAFSTLMSECSDLGFEILSHEKLPLMLEGTWYCGHDEHKGAVPQCPDCKRVFSLEYIRMNRSEGIWSCPNCSLAAIPECLADHDTAKAVRWEWDY